MKNKKITRRPIHIPVEMHDRFKAYCKADGYSLEYINELLVWKLLKETGKGNLYVVKLKGERDADLKEKL